MYVHIILNISRDAYVEFSQDHQPGSHTGPRIDNTFPSLKKSQAKGLFWKK